ncbi:hypothetical protein B7P43_G05203 [Cryptotermes secundus]|uniref:Uncharacterized protein n=1 Tax=Cryptotermes secundus TaxID=105785 RepID=A0A2J7QAF5_9NEOP|nr:hypothetical protein B7P43_G05203 [Cryptotermes secundus]
MCIISQGRSFIQEELITCDITINFLMAILLFELKTSIGLQTIIHRYTGFL